MLTLKWLKGTSGDPVFGVSSCSRLLLVIFQRFQRFHFFTSRKKRFDQHLALSSCRLVASTPSPSPLRHPTPSPPLPLSFLLVYFCALILSLPNHPPSRASISHHGSSVSPRLLTCLSAVRHHHMSSLVHQNTIAHLQIATTLHFCDIRRLAPIP